MPHIGVTELLILLGIFVLLFGAKKIPELASALGKSVVEFRKGVKEGSNESESGEHSE